MWSTSVSSVIVAVFSAVRVISVVAAAAAVVLLVIFVAAHALLPISTFLILVGILTVGRGLF